MSPFIRIKGYVINLNSLAYIHVDANCLDFGFALPTEKAGGASIIRLERGSHLQDVEFDEVKEFVLQLPDPDRVIVI